MSDHRKLTIIATKGTLDWAYPPFILGSTAAALGMEVSIFYTFYGLNLLLKDTSALKVTPMGNPAMPMKMPVGPKWLRAIDFGPKVPNVMWNIPFMDSISTVLMKKTISNCGVASIAELRELCQEAEVKFLACQMTVELFGYDHSQFIDGVDYVGAATYFDESSDATQSLYI
jgi:peroxiredoxin family protein